jgi:hypothetical protein
MTTFQLQIPPETRRKGRQAGYVIAIVVNLVMLVIAQNILEWGWAPFLTSDFAQIVPWVSFSLIASMAMNAIYLLDDRPDVKSLGQMTVNLISLIVTYRIWQVFPFDFSAYDFNWDLLTHVILILAFVGSGIGLAAETLKLANRHLKTGNLDKGEADDNRS